VECIHLLKVNVEGSELDVLAGVTDELWARVRSVVVETQAFEGRVEHITRLLASKGFTRVSSVKKPYQIQVLLDEVNIFGMKT
jgi:hypothetical protein